MYNLTSSDSPHFQIAGLTPGTTYQFAVYAHNIKGQSAKILFNATTLNLAEKRTAETRSKVGAVINEQNEAEKEKFGNELSPNRVDPGLALLPIIAILCGVALGMFPYNVLYGPLWCLRELSLQLLMSSFVILYFHRTRNDWPRSYTFDQRKRKHIRLRSKWSK